MRPQTAFTLIELLIVIAIIAILAAVAVPNFIEAQTRSKVARAVADLRTIGQALESYAVDTNDFPPNDGAFNIIPVELTTPISYLATNLLIDPFAKKTPDPIFGGLVRYYTYDKIISLDELAAILSSPDPKIPPVEAVDYEKYNPGAFNKYGHWRLVSNGPDRLYDDPAFVKNSDPLDPANMLCGSDVRYDPTNGTLSKGNILRTQIGK